jgi:cytochrome c556
MSNHRLFSAAIALLFTVVALAHDAPTKAEQAIEYRHGLYGAIAWNFGPINAMAQGKAPYDKNAVMVRAARVVALAEMLPEAFPEGSAIKGKSEAKPAIWEHRAEFDALLKKFAEKTQLLNEGAKSGDFDKVKALTQDTRAVCKECHEKYKED